MKSIIHGNANRKYNHEFSENAERDFFFFNTLHRPLSAKMRAQLLYLNNNGYVHKGWIRAYLLRKARFFSFSHNDLKLEALFPIFHPNFN